MFKNEQNVQRIVMHPKACLKCDAGQDWYKIDFDVIFVPDKSYPDYMDVETFIKNALDGETMNIEVAGYLLKDYLLTEYKPKGVTVVCNVKDCKTHFDVEVTI